MSEPKTVNGKRTIEGWSYLARCVVMNISQETADAIGKLCFEAEAKGENCSVWHQSAIHFNRQDKCNCGPCCKARNERIDKFKYHHVG